VILTFGICGRLRFQELTNLKIKNGRIKGLTVILQIKEKCHNQSLYPPVKKKCILIIRRLQALDEDRNMATEDILHLTCLDFYLWGRLKDLLFQDKPTTRENMMGRI
ncbi:hypothetical protein HUJ04_003191, partial [Dendroctonus ponderosae]